MGHDLHLQLRSKLDLFANVLPIRLWGGVNRPLAGRQPDRIDGVMVHENTEGQYASRIGGTNLRGGVATAPPWWTPARGPIGWCDLPSTWRASAAMAATCTRVPLAEALPGSAAGQPAQDIANNDAQRPRQRMYFCFSHLDHFHLVWTRDV